MALFLLFFVTLLNLSWVQHSFYHIDVIGRESGDDIQHGSAESIPAERCAGFECVPAPQGLISWVPLDDDATALVGPDGIGYGATGTIGMVDGAFRFNGVNDRIDLGNDAVFLAAFQELSIDAWVKPTQHQQNGTVVSKTELDGWAMRISNGELRAEIRTEGGNMNVNFGSVPLNEYSFVAITYDSDSVRAYINGEFVGGEPLSGPIRNVENATTHVFIGNEPREGEVHTGITEYNFIGDIDEVEIFNRALSAQEIMAIYNAGCAGKCKGDCPGDFPIVEDFNNGILNDPNWVLQGSATLDSDWLQLTDDIGGQAGNAILNSAFSSADFVLVEFEYATVDYNGNNCNFGIGDGLAFFLIDGTASPSIGISGAALGYSHGTTGNPANGIDGGFIAVGLDEFGSFSGGNAAPGTCTQLGPDAVTIRGEETANNLTAYPCLGTTLLPGGADIDVPSRAAARKVRIILSPGGILDLYMDLNDGNGLVPVFSGLDTGQEVPPTFKLGFSASTGGACIAHEIDNLSVGRPADIDVNIDGPDSVSLCDGSITYTVTAINHGPNIAEDIVLLAELNGSVESVSWDCTDCVITNGSGSDISTGVDLGVGDTIVMTISVEVTDQPGEVHLFAGIDFGCSGVISSDADYSMAESVTEVQEGTIGVGTDTFALCPGETFILPSGAEVTAPGTFTDTIPGFACDSIITISLIELPLPTGSVSAYLCNGETYIMPSGEVIGTEGIYTDTIPGYRCDSIVIVELSFSDVSVHTISEFICEGDSATIDGLAYYYSSGIYSDTLEGNGCDSAVILNLTVVEIPTTSIQQAICDGQSATINGIDFYSDPGIYTETLSGWRCDSVVTLELTVQNLTIDSVIVSPADCRGEGGQAVIVHPDYPGPITYTITNVSGQSAVYNNPTVTLGSGTYSVTLSDPRGCEASSEFTVEQTSQTSIVVEPAFSTIYAGMSVELIAQPAEGLFSWSPSQFLSCPSCATTLSTPEYSIQYIVTNDRNNCLSSDTAYIQVIQPEAYVPSAFSPNGDQINDVFQIQDKNIEELVFLRIYNRWGELVFETRSLDVGWDGTFNGKEQEMDAYIYHAAVVLNSGQLYELKGEVLLIR